MNKWLRFLLFFLIALFLCPQDGEAQRRRRYKQRFRAGLLLGGNLSQVDGDMYNGFDKPNLQFGVSAAAILNKRSELGFELLYIGKGSKMESRTRGARDIKDRNIDLRYMEVPIYYRVRQADEAPCSFIELGFSFGRIVSSRVVEPEVPGDGYFFSELEEDFGRNEFSLLAAYGYEASRHLSFKFRFGFALTEFYTSGQEQETVSSVSYFIPGSGKNIDFLRNYYMGILGHYSF